MRSKIFFLCLLMLSFLAGCSSKSNDQSAANTTAATATNGAPAPATSDTGTNAATSPSPESTAPAASAPAPAPAPAPVAIVIPAGTSITVRTTSALGSGTSQSGDSFAATLANPIRVGGEEVVRAGARAEGTVAEAKAKGKIKGAAVLRLELTSLTIHGNSYPIHTSMAGFAQKGKGKRTAIATGGGAALGGIIGGLAGGGKGAAIGLLAGGGAGLAGGSLTGNKQIELPAESALTFKLRDSVTLK